MLLRLSKLLYERGGVVGRILSFKPVKVFVKLISPSNKLFTKSKSLQKLIRKWDAASVEITKNELIMTLKSGLRFVYVKDNVLLALHQEFERATHTNFLSFVKKNSVVLDIGANIGWYAIPAAKKQAQVHAFEPVPSIQQLLERNIELNDVKVHLVKKGLGQKAGKLKFTTDRFGQNKVSTGSSKAVVISPVIKLDDYVKQQKFKRIDLIKADIEGFELPMLKGAEFTLKKYSPKIFLEIEEHHTKTFGYLPQELFAYLSSFGYKPVRVFDGKNSRTCKSYKDLDFGNNVLFEKKV